MNMDGKIEADTVYNVFSKAYSTIKAGLLPKIVNDGNLHFVKLKMIDNKTVVDETIIWLQKDNNWRTLFHIPVAALQLKMISGKVEKNENIYKITVRNNSSVPALNVMVSIIS